MKKALILIALVGILAGCDNAIESAYKEQIVVGAFLYAGEQTGWIVLHRTTPFGSYFDDLDYAVDSATVTLTVDGVAHVLKPGDIKGRYYLPANELIVQGGKHINSPSLLRIIRLVVYTPFRHRRPSQCRSISIRSWILFEVNHSCTIRPISVTLLLFLQPARRST